MSTQIGRQAEDAASRYLARRGYEILSRNVRLGRGEIDIVARRQDILAFVEVKKRNSREEGMLAMHKDKCTRLVSATTAYIGCHPKLAQLQSRFDLIILTPGRLRTKIEHMQDVIQIT